MAAQGNGRDFHHPYKPYDIQTDLMNAIYDTIKQGKVGIFESPTGTGKSLSLICSASTWLRDHQEEEALSVTKDPIDDQEPAWVIEQAAKSRRVEAARQHVALETRLRSIREKQSRQNARDYIKAQSAKKSKHLNEESSKVEVSLDQFELEDYESDHDSRSSMKFETGHDLGLSSSSLKMMEQVGLKSKADEDDDPISTDQTRIFYCSRTHSQLQQFVHELRRVKVPAPWWSSITNKPQAPAEAMTPELRHMSLGSRKNLCIYPKVSQLKNVASMNEKCLEIQQPKTAQDARCPYVPKKGNEAIVNQFRDTTTATVHDIEEIGSLGRQLGTCPYYASRASAESSELITLPYPLLLQQSARDALGLSLNGHVVVIDEAHNLMDTISSIQSSSISLTQLKKSRSSLGIYLQKFRHRLKGKNRVYIAQVVRLIDSLVQYAQERVMEKTNVDGVVHPQDLLKGKGLDQINLNKLIVYLDESKLARKVEGYIQAEQEEKALQDPSKVTHLSTTPVLRDVQSFLQVLNNPAEEGCFLYEKTENQDIILKYMLLDPTWHFKTVVDQARSVILLGGTMSPMEDYARYLFPYLPEEKIQTWSCGHIIPKENLIASPVSMDGDRNPLEFTYEKRDSLPLIVSLGRAITDLVCCIPDGVVVFFPSYAYLDKVIDIWKRTKSGKSGSETIMHQLERVKPVFQESKASSIDEVLISYSASVDQSKGGLLLSVVGGRLSEGINFSDALGRGIIVVGLPFPNARSAQWKAKMDYIEKSVTKRTGSVSLGKEASRDYYENACLRAVNQSIGRAIRHREDFASIILLDKRYQNDRIKAKLPAWIRQGMIDKEDGLEVLTERLRSFFVKKQM